MSKTMDNDHPNSRATLIVFDPESQAAEIERLKTADTKLRDKFQKRSDTLRAKAEELKAEVDKRRSLMCEQTDTIDLLQRQLADNRQLELTDMYGRLATSLSIIHTLRARVAYLESVVADTVDKLIEAQNGSR